MTTDPTPGAAREAGTARDAGSARGSAHAKLILLGEHAVVHGRPAVAMGLPHLRVTALARRVPGPVVLATEEYTGPAEQAPATLAPLVTAATATLAHLGAPARDVELAVRSGIPLGRGLGSSAASAHAIVEALSALHGAAPDEQERFDLVQQAERVAHGNPSGLDAHATRMTSGAIVFQAGRVTPLTVGLGTSLVLADTGVRGSTLAAVADVRRTLEQDAARGTALLDELERLALDGAQDLALDRREELGRRMTRAHALLTDLGAGHAALDGLVGAALDAGALGAKLTGGGQGGCVVALAPTPAAAADLVTALEEAGAVGTWVLPPQEAVA